MRAVQAIVRGTVQGVGFRAFVEREAQALGLDGWVRNRRDGTVEAVLAGEDAVVDRVLMALRVGPPASKVDGLTITPHEEPVAGGFRTLPTE
jgi:acylphosphatase